MDGESSGSQLKRRRKEPSAGGDRLSKLEDRALGHILSFLPAKEAARAALLSPRWRHVFAAVHTVSLDEPEGTNTDDDDNRGYDSPSDSHRRPPPFPTAVSAAIIGRQRRRGVAPLRALRVAMERYRGHDTTTVDQWVSYAAQHAAPEGLDLDLRIWCRRMLCNRPYALREGNNQAGPEPDMYYPPLYRSRPSPTVDVGSQSDDEDEDERDNHHDQRLLCDPPEYIVPRLLFSCAELRSLCLSSCRLSPPRTITLPSLVTLLLSHVPDGSTGVKRLVAGCPRLTDLTLEMCEAVTTLTVLGGARLRRLAIRCCHNLAAVAVDSSELRTFEYMGAVPDSASFLTMHGDAGSIAYCKVDLCGTEATSEVEITNLRHLLHQFVNAKHLHLESDRLGYGFDKDVMTARFASFSGLRHLEMRGCLPNSDTGIIDAMRRVLEHTPNLEALSLAFHPQKSTKKHDAWGVYHEPDYSLEEELDAAHHLGYNRNLVLATPTTMIPCLRSKVREINLVHYHGGTAQRTLAKFLLCNAPAIDKLWCEFAEGPMWMQVQLMREIKGWLINKSANTHFA
ncbi:unnamed protein product [Urochloa decumbens]|uniref:F-box domain-containing protein n=1 Tax=Urochloa decumbens TaxID=240449 RepID=A0ABC9GI01_9POAL